jgi:hypothetical protein
MLQSKQGYGPWCEKYILKSIGPVSHSINSINKLSTEGHLFDYTY